MIDLYAQEDQRRKDLERAAALAIAGALAVVWKQSAPQKRADVRSLPTYVDAYMYAQVAPPVHALYRSVYGIAVDTVVYELPQLGIAVSGQVSSEVLDGFAWGHTDRVVRLMTENTKKAIRKATTDFYLNGKPISWLRDQLAPQFGADRAEAIAITETTNGFNDSLVEQYQRYGVQRGEWQTVYDDRVCPECEALNGFVFTFGAPDEIRPALHVRCRCRIVPA